jgi:hypothetical protein
VRNVPRVDLAMYLQAIPSLVRHLSILVAPLLAAVVSLLLNELGQTMTDPIGGIGAGIYAMIAQLVYLTAFGIAVIQASNIWRGRDGKFDTAWEEGRRKIGGIILAAIGFQFVFYVAGLVGGLFGIGIFALILQLAAAFFLIYTIPAAAIGGLPGQLAISASIRAVRANPIAAIVLAFAFIVLWIIVPNYALLLVVPFVPPAAMQFVFAGVQALVLAYLVFPFAKQYDDVAFRANW